MLSQQIEITKKQIKHGVMIPIKFIITIAFLLMTNSLFAQSVFEGNWEGAFIREGSIQLTDFHLEIQGDSLIGYHDIPERELYHEPLTNFSIKEDTLFFRSRYGPFWIIKDSNPEQLLGMSVQWNPKIKLHLKKSSQAEQYFTSEKFTSQNGDITLAGKIYKPVIKPIKNKLIILVHGSGPVVMDDRYYRTEALALVKRGYHVAVYDKRGNGSSTGSMQGSTLFDFADDAVSILNTLGQLYGERFAFGFLGISQGGWVSTIASTKTDRHDFLILNVGPAVSLFQQEIDRVQFTLQQNGYDVEVVHQATEHVKLMFKLVDDSSLWSRYIESSKKMEELDLGEIVNTVNEKNDRHVSWWRANQYDPQKDLLKQEVPVLSLLGGSDPLVPPATNKKLMKSLLDKSRAPFHEVVEFKDAYHNLHVFGTLKGGTWNWPSGYWVWQHKAEGVYLTIDHFLDKLE